MNKLLAAAVVAALPLAALADGKPRPPADPADPPPSATAPSSTERPLSFEQLDANKDGRISMPEASADPKLVESFSTADKNGDGYLDATEFANAVETPPPKQ